MDKKQLLAHFNKHFARQFVIVDEGRHEISGSQIARLRPFNPVVEVLRLEAYKYGFTTRFLVPGKRTKPEKGNKDRIVPNRLTIQIRRCGNGAHKIGRILNY